MLVPFILSTALLINAQITLPGPFGNSVLSLFLEDVLRIKVDNFLYRFAKIRNETPDLNSKLR